MTTRIAYARQEEFIGSGIARSTVFPNTIRDLRCAAGYPSLQAFGMKLPEITYTRLGKIERGEIFPRFYELGFIADILGVAPSELFVDTTNPKFDRETWARAHVEGKMFGRSGSFEDMKLGATLRVRRRARDLATTEMKVFNLPAATVSRIENAERAFSRWDTSIRIAVRRVIGAENFSDMWRVTEEMYQRGDLNQTMFEMFSPVSLNERHNKAMLELLQPVQDARGIYLKSQIEQLMVNDNSSQLMSAPTQLQAPAPALAQVKLYNAVTTNGITLPVATEEMVAFGKVTPLTVALMLDSEVLGPGSPVGTILIFEPIEYAAVKAGNVIALGNADGLRLCHVVRTSPKLQVTQAKPSWSGHVSKVDQLYVLIFSIDKENTDNDFPVVENKRRTLKLVI